MNPPASSTTLSTIDVNRHVADLVTEDPRRAAVFERLGIEYCCGGKVALADACAAKELDVADVISQLEKATGENGPDIDWSEAGIDDLIDNIIDVHHTYLRAELPRISMLATKVARAHGASNPALATADVEVQALVAEFAEHLETEEQTAFPVYRRIARGELSATPATSAAIAALEDEHESVAQHLETLRDLLDGFVPPNGACTSYRAYLDSLERLELDTHRHVHLENHVLFPKVTSALEG